MDHTPTARRIAGITLVEMLAVIAIGAILMAIGVPSFRSVTNANRIAGEVNGLLGDLEFARAEAIKEGRTVTTCASSDGATCSASTAWQRGWLVFSDANGNGSIDAGEVILRVQTPFTGTDTFQASNNVSAVSFNREGVAIGIASGSLLTLHDATASATSTRCLSITMVGLLTTQTVGGSCT